MAVYKIAIEHYPLLELAESRFAKEKERMKRALRSYQLRNHLSKSWRVKGPRVELTGQILIPLRLFLGELY